MAEIWRAKSYGLWMERASAVAVILFAAIAAFTLWKMLALNFIRLQNPISLVAVLFIWAPPIALTFYFLDKESKSLRNWQRGNIAEEAIETELSKLPDDYTIIRNVCLRGLGGDIDAIVVGPSSVSVVEVKSWRGAIAFDGEQLTVNGCARPKGHATKQVNRQCSVLRNFLHEQLGVWLEVHPIVALTSYVDIRFGKKLIDGAIVVHKRWLREVIVDLPAGYSGSFSERILGTLRGLI